MVFKEIIYCLLNKVKESTQNALERALPQLKKENLEMSQQAFSAARQKIKWEAFEELFHASVTGSYQEEIKLWRGYRVMAVDGTFLNLPSDAALVEYFGGLGYYCSTAGALASLLYDLENNIIIDAKIAPISGNERALAEEHLCKLQGMDSFNQGHRELLICDRGYPSHEFVKSLSDKEIAYVMRAQKGFISERYIEGKKDCLVPLGKTGLQTRVVQITLATGEREILITNLPKAEVEYKAFEELYHKRWGIETKYK